MGNMMSNFHEVYGYEQYKYVVQFNHKEELELDGFPILQSRLEKERAARKWCVDNDIDYITRDGEKYYRFCFKSHEHAVLFRLYFGM